ncbi:MAG TPA: hypothetical protein DHV08_06400 [Rhodocyclaceae bacterium]|nr:MAG: hypothetical protein AUK49_09040 [Betaproteobacteria bacterium CG2_30_68_42]PIV71619.1 MAG: hypothetical protein COW56_13890 [Rhodocyclales bacterium CG17_big_fil_post_rev_8_21_14_2_50_68_7]PIX76056.1 MAG: hypothetical protein COZ38_02355 [Rhodocyclales bacterium CG_4_10_14_3_um_filter_68_10]PJA58281.1 MAG: hypothetical protein CO164_03410 [Rhodocyclales bacterium CG_4_9_14_3_um_filter_68_10]HCX33209.1 hypothetical protein [Rhodocyclaceae bacterium]
MVATGVGAPDLETLPMLDEREDVSLGLELEALPSRRSVSGVSASRTWLRSGMWWSGSTRIAGTT